MSNIIPFPGRESPPNGDPESRLVLPPSRDRAPKQSSKELVPQVFEAEIVDEPDDDTPTPVDLPAAPDTRPRWQKPVELQPVIPDWAAKRETRAEVVSWHVHHAWHATRYHGLRSPWYALRLAWKSPVGAARVAGLTYRWVRVSSMDERLEPVKSDPKAVRDLTLKQSEQANTRAVILVGILLSSAISWWLLGRNHVGWDRPLVVILLVGAFGLIADRRSDRPILGPSVHVEQAQRLTSDVVMTALASLGIDGINKALRNGWSAKDVFTAPITRDGKGWRADVSLPGGVTAGDVIGKRTELASGLRRPLGCVWPEPDPDPEQHPGKLILWVGDKSMSSVKPPAWPLAKAGQADLFKPIPFGHDQRGRPVSVTLMYANVLIGAIPRMGKTFALRVLLLASALDPRVELRLFELKGTGDFSPLEPVAHHYASGAGNDAVEACLMSLREVHTLLETRATAVRKIAKTNRELCPENKVTPELAARRQLGLYPIVFGVAECQVLFTHPDYGQEAARLCEDIIKRGPAMAIMLLLATQRPDAKSLPTGISANVAIRFCLRVMGQVENDMVLGTSSYKNGIRATTLTSRDKGIGYLLGDADDPQIVRSSYIDGPTAERIVERARKLREAAGTLTGYALGEQEFDTGPDTSLVRDLLQVMGSDEEKAHHSDLCMRLEDAWSSRYEGWTPRTLGAALKAAGVRGKQVWCADPDGQSRNGWGVERADLEAIVASRYDAP